MSYFIRKKRWVSVFHSVVIRAVVLLLLLSTPRFILVLQANRTGQYQWVSIFFMIMIILPWLLLKSPARRNMGIRQIRSGFGLLAGVVAGMLCAVLIYYVMLYLFGDGIAHPYRYIARSYQQLPVLELATDRLMFFAIYSLISMTLSPLGEELFYRGLVHEYFARSLGHQRASVLDSVAFALVHLAHFGIVYNQGRWYWLFWPSIIWMLGLFLSCQIFFWARQTSGAIWGAVASHAAFNLGMNYFIFFHLL